MREPDSAAPRPDALAHYPDIAQRLARSRPVMFVDYDGTLTPIADRPELAILADDVRTRLRTLARLCTVAVVSGRDRVDVQRLVGLGELIYAGSHGYDIAGPNGLGRQHDSAVALLPTLDRAEIQLRHLLAGIDGALVERKRFAIAVHYRLVTSADVDRVAAAVDAVLAGQARQLRRSGGKKVFELRPRLDWDKGRAVLWLLDWLQDPIRDERLLPLYIGDDETDEDAFIALRSRGGIGILVAPLVTPLATPSVAPSIAPSVAPSSAQATAAHYRLEDPAAVACLLDRLIDTLRTGPP